MRRWRFPWTGIVRGAGDDGFARVVRVSPFRAPNAFVAGRRRTRYSQKTRARLDITAHHRRLGRSHARFNFHHALAVFEGQVVARDVFEFWTSSATSFTSFWRRFHVSLHDMFVTYIHRRSVQTSSPSSSSWPFHSSSTVSPTHTGSPSSPSTPPACAPSASSISPDASHERGRPRSTKPASSPSFSRARPPSTSSIGDSRSQISASSSPRVSSGASLRVAAPLPETPRHSTTSREMRASLARASVERPMHRRIARRARPRARSRGGASTMQTSSPRPRAKGVKTPARAECRDCGGRGSLPPGGYHSKNVVDAKTALGSRWTAHRRTRGWRHSVRGVFAAEQDGDAPSDVRDVGDGGRADRVSEGQDGVERGVETEGGFGLDRGFRSTGRRGGAAEGRRELFQVSRARNGAVRRRGV